VSSYLSDRTQIVKMFNVKSNSLSFSCGVIQGGHLSPFLFLVFINNINSVFKHRKFLLFADDIKIFSTINHINDCLKLQMDLDCFSAGCSVNGFHLNTDICMQIYFHHKRSPTVFEYRLVDYNINVVNEIKDLNIILSDLSFKCHVETICAKVIRKLGFIKRNCADIYTCLKVLYFGLVWSVLEFGSVIWNHRQIGLIKKKC